MGQQSRFNRLFTTALVFSLLNSLPGEILTQFPSQLGWGNTAEARSSGGRSRSGSFSRSSSSSSSRSSSSRSSSSSSSSRPSSSSRSSSFGSSSSSRPSSSRSSFSSPRSINRGDTGGRSRGGSFTPRQTPSPAPVSPRTTPRRTTPRPVYNPPVYPNQNYPRTPVAPPPVVPAPGYPTQTYPVTPNSQTYPVQTAPVQTAPAQTVPNQNEDEKYFWIGLIFLLIVGGVSLLVIVGIIALIIKATKPANSGKARELSNNIVTVTRLQVALLAQAKEVQQQLSQLSIQADLESPQGLQQFLQESALTVLRSPENWTHLNSSSQTVSSREEAQSLFEQFSVQERSKFTAETLSHVHGNLRRSSSQPAAPEDEVAAYIVVTFLVGTEDDQPLFEKVRTEAQLKQALEKLATLPSNYLLIFELLWSPQAETDSLSEDELIAEYAELAPLA